MTKGDDEGIVPPGAQNFGTGLSPGLNDNGGLGASFNANDTSALHESRAESRRRLVGVLVALVVLVVVALWAIR